MNISKILLSISAIDYYSQKKVTFITTERQNVSFFFKSKLDHFSQVCIKAQNLKGNMKLTSKGRYAVMALVDLARFDTINPVSLRDISLRQGISLDYLEQIFSKLKKNQIVKSTRGIQGGYILSKKPNEIKLNNILNAVDEKVKTVQCKKESKKGCNGKATKCVTHNLWDELETHINTFFEKKSLQDLLKNNSERVN